MACEHVPLPGGGAAIVCTTVKRPRCACGRPAPNLCDWKVPARESGTCDTPVCDRCTTSPAPGKDLCCDHAMAYEEWLAARDEPVKPDDYHLYPRTGRRDHTDTRECWCRPVIVEQDAGGFVVAHENKDRP